MKLLVLTLNAWDETGSTGNTISNLLRDSEDIEVANIFCRNEKVNNSICKNYFQITESQIIKSLLPNHKCGRAFEIESTNTVENDDANILVNNALGNFLRKYRPASLLFARELIWSIPTWKNERLDSFLKSFQPDVIYMHGHTNIYMHRLMEYCSKKTGAKIAMFYGDDMYGRKYRWPIGYLFETLYRKRLRRSISISSLLFGGSLKLCKEYSSLFGKDFIPMFKQCDLSKVKGKTSVGNPIRIVYAGNLLFGREDAMVRLIKYIEQVNQETTGRKYQIDIFSNTMPKASAQMLFEKSDFVEFKGRRPYSEVCEVMNESDLVLFLESFEKKNIRETRLSFSTKIIDCMQADSAMLAIGPSEIASMEYIKENKIGLTASSLDDIHALLMTISEKPQLIIESASEKFQYADWHHSNTSIQYQALLKGLK